MVGGWWVTEFPWGPLPEVQESNTQPVSQRQDQKQELHHPRHVGWV